MKKTVFWHVTRYSSCKNRRFGGTYCLHYQVDMYIVFIRNVLRFLVTPNVPISPILVTLR
jgi:hypothetical protein